MDKNGTAQALVENGWRRSKDFCANPFPPRTFKVRQA